MASEHKRRIAVRGPIEPGPELAERLRRTAPRPSAALIPTAGAALCLFYHAGAWAAGPVLPNLPVPCAGATCGVHPGNTPFVTAGSATLSSPNSTTLNVNQSSTAAILNWANFNIAKGSAVTFNLPSSTAATLNRIWSQDASVIAGKLSSNGQIYLINQNGIVFNQGAQVNVGGLIASTLDISDSLFQNGILSGNPNVPVNSPTQLKPVFQASGQAGGVLVDSGAELDAASGGRIVLLGSKVTNNGTINTPDGQTILGAGNTVYLAASTDPALRGLLIEVNGGGSAANSTVVNTGSITADRGNITLAGLVVNQAGNLTATTSVNANGSIYLVAGDTSGSGDGNFFVNNSGTVGFGSMLPNAGGSLTLAPGSLTQVLPDSSDTATITNAQTFQPSQVELVGGTVALDGNAAIRAPGATVGVSAAANPFAQAIGAAPPVSSNGSRIYLDSGSVIDVSGLQNVQVPVGQDLVTVKLESNDLQNDPLLRDGFLHGQTVTVNVAGCLFAPTTCSTLFDLTPYISNIAYGIQQKLTVAGTIKLNSTGDVITRAGSTLNVSGGSVAFQAGMAAATTQLVAANGKIYNIATAPNNIQYIALANGYSYTDPSWGVTTLYQPQAYYSAFTQGSSAGLINVLGPQDYLLGSMLGQTTAGIYQRTAGNVPSGGTFILGDSSKLSSTEPVDFRAPSVVFNDGVSDTLSSTFDPFSSSLPSSFTGVTTLSPTALTQNGFNNIAVYSNGSVTVPIGTSVALSNSGSFTAAGQSVEIDGRISGTGASVNLTATQNVNATQQPVHDVSFGDGASIDVAGGWVNDQPQSGSAAGTGPILINGGSVTAKATDDVVLGDNVLIDVSGGAHVDSSGKLNAGNAGSISLAADVGTTEPPPVSGAVKPGSGDQLVGAAFLGGKGGTLSLQSGLITVGTQSSDPTVTTSKPTGTLGELLLSPAFFEQGGFANYNMVGVNGVNIGTTGSAVTIAPLQQNLVPGQASALNLPTGANPEQFAVLTTLPSYQRSAANVSFASASANPVSVNQLPGLGDVVLGKGSSIVTDAGGSVTLAVNKFVGSVDVLGNISTPGGNITLQLAPASGVTGAADYGYIGSQQIGSQLLPSQQIDVASTAQLLARGTVVLMPNQNGLSRGSLLGGGTVSLLANKGYVNVESGALIDVSGTAATLDIANAKGVTPTLVAGNAGTINIHAREGIVLQGSLLGQAAAAPGAAAGTLNIGLDTLDHSLTGTFNASSPISAYSNSDRVLTISDQSASQLSSTLSSGSAQISTGTIEAGGFDSVNLSSTDTIALQGAVTLSARNSITLNAPRLQGGAGSAGTFTAAYVAIGNNSGNPAATDVNTSATPAAGNANLVVSAQQLDVKGNSVLAGFASTTLESTGDLRLTPGSFANTTAPYYSGSLNTAGDLTLQAGQVYPTSATSFTINTPGKVQVLPGTAGTPATPLSAGGSLTINAATIDQEGVVRAPVGQIALNATGSGSVTLGNGSLTSVSANGLTIPYGTTQNGQQWLYGSTDLISAPPAKQISINGTTVSIGKGAKVDLSGGGDLYAYEFIAGPGGSRDVLDPANGVYSYAILPSLGTNPAPVDAVYGVGSSISPGKDIYLSGVPGLAAGYYTLLPARYALLPGAYAVKVVEGNSDLAQGSVTQQTDGSYLVAGRMGVAGTSILDSRTSTVELVPGSVVRTQSQYNDSYANTFFSSAAATANAVTPPLPADAGQLSLGATGSLDLNGTINFQAGSYVSGKDSSGNNIVVQGRGGVASIVAPDIVVVDQVGDAQNAPADALQVTAASLNQLGAASLVLGASETAQAAGTQLNVGASTVQVQNSSADALVASEIILAATGTVSLAKGSDVEGKGSSGAAITPLLVKGDGAALRVSGGAQTTLDRSGAPAPGSAVGIVDIADGATVKAAGSLILDAAANVQLGNASIGAPAVTLSSSQINLGAVPSGTTGLNISSQLLSGFQGLTDLGLHSYGTINFYGPVQLGSVDANGKPSLNSVSLDAGALGGYGAGDKTVDAGSITLMDSGNSGAAFAAAPDGSGALKLSADGASGSIVLGAGAKSITGFSGVQLASSGSIQAQGSGGTLTLSEAGNLDLRAVGLVTADGADQSIVNRSGAVTIDAVTPAAGAAQPTAGIGGKLSITGTSIAQNGSINLPAGVVSLEATGAGGITLGSGSGISAAGVVRPYGDTYAAVSGGQITLTADQGNVQLGQGATVDVSGASSSDGSVAAAAGTLSVSAAAGQLVLGGALKGAAAAGQQQGSFNLDTGSIGDFGALASTLSAGGFSGAVSERVRSGDINIASGVTIKANSYTLSADQGAITVAGTIDSSGGSALSADGGDIALWAGKDLTLASGAALKSGAGTPAAGAQPAHGGDITLSTSGGTLNLQSGSGIDLRGSGADSGGALTLRAPRTSSGTDLAIGTVGSSISNSGLVVVEGNQVYQASTLSNNADGGGNLSIGQGGAMYQQAAQFAGNAAAIQQRLFGGGSGLNIEVRPGVEVQSSGDLALNDTWDLSTWRFNNAPIDLSLRAAGNLSFNASLSDGFTSVGGAPSGWTFGASGNSASYRLVSGADLGAADALAVAQPSALAAGSGNFVLAAGQLIRTGNGNIDIASGADVLLGCPLTGACDSSNPAYSQALAQQSVIYTAGVPSARLANFPLPTAVRGAKLNAAYPTDGGNISISAAGNVRSAPSNQLVSDWLWRRGATNADGSIATGQNTSWWIMFNRFQQGVGALGGGNLSVQAGGDIVNLSAVVPTTGRLAGAAGTQPDAANLVINGGGSLRVQASGNIASGLFEADDGNAQISAGGALTSARTLADTNPGFTSLGNPQIYPILVEGSGTFDVSARTGVTIDAAVNATVLPESSANLSSVAGSGTGRASSSYFYTFSSTSSLNLISASGDIRLNNDTAVPEGGAGGQSESVLGNLAPGAPYDPNYDYSNLSVYPPSISAAALSGNLVLSDTSFYPSASGNLSLLAQGNVTTLGQVQMYETDPAQAPNVLLPSINLTTPPIGTGDLASVPLPLTPLHQNDSQPARIVAQGGSIINSCVKLECLVLPKAAQLIAGRDIVNLSYSGKNLNASDVTLFQAGGSISFATPTDSLTHNLLANTQGIRVGGPGYVEVMAGGNINLGDSNGVVTTGNLNDSRLPSGGATMVVGAGLGSSSGSLRQPAYASFVSTYLKPDASGNPSPYAPQLITYMKQLLGLSASDSLGYADALSQFQALPFKQQLPLVAQVLYAELSATGIAHNTQGSNYDRGYTAINTLFPTTDAQGKVISYSGDINMFFSQLKTEQGGNIDLLAPGGSVVVGVPNPPAALNAVKALGIPAVPAAANLGILVLSTGAVDGFAADNFTVNQSRILTLEGGDIILWASNGDIDAGRGAKSASAAPPPVIQTDAQGNIFVNPLGAVSGSGIGQLVTTPGVKPGLVNLIAPNGDVNAGDAGIRVAGNLNIAAVVVIGASNISVGGTATGVPTSDAGALSGALSGANALGDTSKNAVSQLTQNLADASAAAQQLADSLKPSFVVVKLICLGTECELQ